MDEAATPQPGDARASALRRAALVKRWVAGGAVALTGIFSAVAAHALPASHSKHRASAAATSSPPPPSPGLDDEGSAPQQSIPPPAVPPQASSAGSGVVSGGS
jgi:hypothetical protein